MKNRATRFIHWVTGMIGAALMAAAGLGLAADQGGAAESSPPKISVQANAGTGFTYQGLLTIGSTPANGVFDLEFSLFDAVTDGAQLGAPHTHSSATIANGAFSILLNDAGQFGLGALNGEARWIQIAVRFPAGAGEFTVLAPRQLLSPAPMAFALPGLYTVQTNSTPNIIGGYSGNIIQSEVVGGTISGGGSSDKINFVSENFGTVGGGSGNRVGDDDSNPLNAKFGTIAGGEDNLVSHEYGAVGGGKLNKAAGGNAFVGGGLNNTAEGSVSVVVGGNSNRASSGQATVGGGQDNNATSAHSTVAGGLSNLASGSRSTIGGGRQNTASAVNSTITGGQDALASRHGEMAYADGSFAAQGDAQTSLFVLRNTSTGLTATELFLDGIGERITIPTGTTMTFEILVVGRTSGNVSAGYRIVGVIENAGGTTAFVDSPTVTTLGEDNTLWSATVLADDANDALVIQVTGSAALTIRWVATVRAVQVRS